MSKLNPLLLATTIAQLTLPTELPTFSANFQLIAHVKSPNTTQFAAGIENWEVASLPASGCHEPIILKKPCANGTASGTTFWFDAQTTGVAYGDGENTKMLLIPKGGHGERALGMDCKKGTPGVEVIKREDGPQLVHGHNGTFY
ncbi:hypothetical protein ED733_001073, partial [Metarhizium rileyi]